MHTAYYRLLLVALFTSSLALADTREPRHTKPSTLSRLTNATTLMVMPDGGMLGIGSSRLQILRPGAKTWELLLDQKGDSLYRVAFDRTGRVLAAWETDPLIHLFSADGKQVSTFPKPGIPEEGVFHFLVEHLAFLPNGRDALVVAQGEKLINLRRNYAYRIALDGKSAPELIYRVDDAVRLDFNGTLALFRIPKDPEQMCEHLRCDPMKALVAYEVLEDGVRRTTLLDDREYELVNAHMVWGNGYDPVVMQIPLERQERLMLSWRRGEPKARVWPFPKGNYSTEKLFATPSGELVELVREGGGFLKLEVRRYPLHAGAPQVTTITYPPETRSHGEFVHGAGVRMDGTLWVHWGDYLILLPKGKRPLRYDLEPLLSRGFEWSETAVYQPNPEVLWIGLDGRVRDYVRVSLDEVLKRAKPL